MTVNLLGLCLDQDLGFIRRQDIVIERLQLAVAGSLHIEDGCHFLASLERVLHNLLAVTADLGVMLAILHRLDAIDAFRAVSAGSYFTQGDFSGMTEQGAQAQHHHQNAYFFHIVVGFDF